MPDRPPTPAELAAYSDCMFRILEAAQRGEAADAIGQAMAAADWPSIYVVDKYLSKVEDGSPIRPMRYEALRQVLTRMFDHG